MSLHSNMAALLRMWEAKRNGGRRKHSGTCFGQVPGSIVSIRPCTLMLLGVFLGSTIAKCHRQAARTQTLSQEPLPLAGGSVSSHLHTVKGDREPSRSLS